MLMVTCWELQLLGGIDTNGPFPKYVILHYVCLGRYNLPFLQDVLYENLPQVWGKVKRAGIHIKVPIWCTCIHTPLLPLSLSTSTVCGSTQEINT